MNKNIATYFSLSVIVLFIVYMAYDSFKSSPAVEQVEFQMPEEEYEENWTIHSTIGIPFGHLHSIATDDQKIVVGGENFLAAYSAFEMTLLWNIETEKSIIALAMDEQRIYASSGESIYLYNLQGKFIEEWGPYDEGAYITSISCKKNLVAFADAGNRIVFIVNKEGALKYFFGQPGNQFIVPSPYFDLAFVDDKLLAIANPGKRQIEYRTLNGEIIEVFGEEGIGLKEFCGCCNPSHFTLLSDNRIVTAEKGINRLKVLDDQGNLIELVSKSKHFKASVPLDLAASDSNILYGANGADSKVYIFKRKEIE